MSVWLKKQRALFLHIPKTGGEWIEEAVKLSGEPYLPITNLRLSYHLPGRHALLGQYRMREMTLVRNVAAFVRHPLHYYSSVWRWLSLRTSDATKRSLQTRWSWHPHREAVEQFDRDFDVWVGRMLDVCPLWYTRLIESYVGPPGGEFCSFIGRTDTLIDDFIVAMRLFGCDESMGAKEDEIRSMPKVNVSGGRVEWNHDLAECVLDTEHKVLDRFFGRNSDRRLYANLATEMVAGTAAERAAGT